MRERVAELVGKQAAYQVSSPPSTATAPGAAQTHRSHRLPQEFQHRRGERFRTLLRRVVEDLGSSETFDMGTFQSGSA